MKELKGDDLVMFSYGHCPFCDNDIEPEDEIVCEQCGTKFYVVCDENGFLKEVYYLEPDYPFKFEEVDGDG